MVACNHFVPLHVRKVTSEHGIIGQSPCWGSGLASEQSTSELDFQLWPASTALPIERSCYCYNTHDYGVFCFVSKSSIEAFSETEHCGFGRCRRMQPRVKMKADEDTLHACFAVVPPTFKQ